MNKLYAIVDNEGNVYSHDITSEYIAKCLLETIFEEYGEETANALEIEIIEQ